MWAVQSLPKPIYNPSEGSSHSQWICKFKHSIILQRSSILSLFFMIILILFFAISRKKKLSTSEQNSSKWKWELYSGQVLNHLKVLWPPHAKSWLIGKDPDAGRDWGQEEKGTTEDEMARWHHWLDGRESQWTPGVGDGQGGLACCDSWGRKESDMTEWLNWTELPK